MARLTSPLTISLFIAGLAVATPAWAGPPFMTDDPEPTETGHWEIYAPLLEAEGSGANFEGSAGVEINYGAAPDVQITVGLPIAYAHDSAGTEWARAMLRSRSNIVFITTKTSGSPSRCFPA